MTANQKVVHPKALRAICQLSFSQTCYVNISPLKRHPVSENRSNTIEPHRQFLQLFTRHFGINIMRKSIADFVNLESCFDDLGRHSNGPRHIRKFEESKIILDRWTRWMMSNVEPYHALDK
ncbi:hypothetical protein CBM2626_B30105 [Cupriavidus taiwanensis]|nr:hypothetical protein CBM2626_B30105 [Cupriavidus taiwanensis]